VTGAPDNPAAAPAEATWPRWSQWFGIATAVAATTFSFLTWSSVSTHLDATSPAGMAGAAANAIEAESGTAWASLPAAVAVLLLVGSGVVAASPLSARWTTVRWLSWLGLAAAALVSIVLAWVTLPTVRDVMNALADRFGVPRSTIHDEDVATGERFIDIEPGVGLYASLALTVLSVVASILAARAAVRPASGATPPPA
jgi:hypothetical protein